MKMLISLFLLLPSSAFAFISGIPYAKTQICKKIYSDNSKAFADHSKADTALSKAATNFSKTLADMKKYCSYNKKN